MTNVTSRPRTTNGVRAVVGAACGLVLMLAPQTAAARPYTVVSCDSAGLFGFSSAAWAPFGNAGWAYESCPTGGGDTAGISNRLIGGTYSWFQPLRALVQGAPGATITAVRWAGRLARDNCNWGTFLRALPSGAAIMGLPNGQYCTSAAFDNRGWPMTFGTPEGTTGVDQLVICGAYPMPPRSNDPRPCGGGDHRRPDPTLDLAGRSAGERGVGERAGRGSRTCPLRQQTMPGFRASRRPLGPEQDRELPVYLVPTTTCATDAADRPVSRRVADLPDGDASCTYRRSTQPGTPRSSAEPCTSTTPRRIPWSRRSSAATHGAGRTASS